MTQNIDIAKGLAPYAFTSGGMFPLPEGEWYSRQHAEEVIAELRSSLAASEKRFREEMENHAQLQARCYEGFPSASDGIFDALKESEKRVAELEAALKNAFGNALKAVQAEAQKDEERYAASQRSVDAKDTAIRDLLAWMDLVETPLKAELRESVIAAQTALSTVPREPAVTDSRAKLEAAFREGYDEGYGNGSGDAAAYEFGSGSKHSNVRAKDKDDAWNGSEARASTVSREDAEQFMAECDAGLHPLSEADEAALKRAEPELRERLKKILREPKEEK